MDFYRLSDKVSFIGNLIMKLRDMKPANIMISKGHAKIGDFGFAKKNSNKRLKI
jgi:serine/threonine protein kinase